MSGRSGAWRRILIPATAVYWIALAVVTHLPPSELPKTHVSDKLAHFVVYAGLGVLLSACFVRRPPLLAATMVIGIAMVYGAADELTQPLVGRTCSIHDWYADVAGAASAAILVAVGHLLSKKPPSPGGIRVT